MGMRDGFELIAQGAEARLYKGSYLGRQALLKERFVKKYRHPDLDKTLTKERIKAEARAIVRAKAAGVVTPAIFLVDFERRCIFMEYIENSVTLKNYIENYVTGKDNVNHVTKSIGRTLGTLIARLHSKNIIHGDLTTSNILIRNPRHEVSSSGDQETLGEFVMVDFGLARVESTIEDKAVDLYVLERSLVSAHSEIPELFPLILMNYQKFCTEKSKAEVIAKYKEVQARGRKRLMIG
ncbi:TP53-regulating kinase [Orussus abietinus]|uniref:TP53-regulating kinase n=1 Tax=Orussus abietinus TaxID=222816 RepID=UPI0006252026|nr:TP53-regulating kinase [Orussus abietinus]XP_012283164.1 TP53-regulating kinase [Orussus abietinus]XP_012283165.1 TP53-regulating kinase [Orussus abietinus]XP_012283166.1 TP53-regulating kinase [Orussus abietinus]XP_012283167.1 TP53-regulating kinase [Orussus abietinus]XP_012283168.1 TP53-regulating kinase [Orussus abietinus]XP_012283169.1 TP53-regulating kinase [Orussus abietinus]